MAQINDPKNKELYSEFSQKPKVFSNQRIKDIKKNF